jgi:hypothetical protein
VVLLAAAGFGCATGRRTSAAGLSSRRPSYTTLAQQIVVGPGQKLHLGHGRTQCTRLSTSGDPKRLVRGGGTSSGIREVASGCRRRHSRSSSAVLMPVPARPA